MLPPSLLNKLARARLRTHLGTARSGVGERRSRAIGAGVEFAEHREYQPGDDFRYLDRHVYSRLGQHVIKQYHLYQRLEVTVLIDSSASMAVGDPSKLERAAQLAGVLGHVGLVGGDRVLAGSLSGGRVSWFRPLEGARRSSALFSWLSGLNSQGAGDLVSAARASLPRLRSGGMLIVVSDWLDEGVDEALSLWRAAEQDLVGVQLLAPEELEPERLGNGLVRLLDLESGQDVEVNLDTDACAGYRKALEDWSKSLGDSFYRVHGRLFRSSTDDDMEATVLKDWRAGGLIS